MIVIPMAGTSRRFLEQGYDKPKFMLPIWGGYVFDYAVASFARDFRTKEFLFVFRETGDVRLFIEQRIRVLRIKNPTLYLIEQPTAGQAETVEKALDQVDVAARTPVTVFNIDTFRLPTARPSSVPIDASGWLEVFHGDGESWSFVRPAEQPGVALETTEKIRISDLCCTGLYHFSSSELFRDALSMERKQPSSGELYIAPIYNHLIAKGQKIGYGVIENKDVLFCGVPDEYESLLKTPPPYTTADIKHLTNAKEKV